LVLLPTSQVGNNFVGAHPCVRPNGSNNEKGRTRGSAPTNVAVRNKL